MHAYGCTDVLKWVLNGLYVLWQSEVPDSEAWNSTCGTVLQMPTTDGTDGLAAN